MPSSLELSSSASLDAARTLCWCSAVSTPSTSALSFTFDDDHTRSEEWLIRKRRRAVNQGIKQLAQNRTIVNHFRAGVLDRADRCGGIDARLWRVRAIAVGCRFP